MCSFRVDKRVKEQEIKVERVGGHRVIYRCEQVKSKKREIDEGRSTREEGQGRQG